jgi:hypothetical protein
VFRTLSERVSVTRRYWIAITARLWLRRRRAVIVVTFVAKVGVPSWLVVAGLLTVWAAPLAVSSTSAPGASKPVQLTSTVRWGGRLVVAEHRRVEGGAADGERRATLHELTAGSAGGSPSRPLLPGEIEADYQLSPDATKIAFRPTDGRHVEMLDLTTRDRWRLALPDGDLDPEAVLYGWCVDGAALWVRSGDSLYLARTARAGPATLIAKAVSPGYLGIEACTSHVAVVARDADPKVSVPADLKSPAGQRVTSALSVETLRQLRVVLPLSFTFSDRHVCWRESFALETLGQEWYGIARLEFGTELRPSERRVLRPAGGAAAGVEALELGLSAFMRPTCLLGAIGPTAVHVLELRGSEVLERGRYADQPELYAALSKTRDQPVWLAGADRRVAAYIDPACQRKVIVRDLETRRSDSIWPSGRVGDCGESVPLGWASDRVVALSWLP